MSTITKTAATRFLVFRRWKPPYATEYNYYYAYAPGESHGITVRSNIYSKRSIAYEIMSVTSESVFSSDNEVCTQEEFMEFYKKAIREITQSILECMQPID